MITLGSLKVELQHVQINTEGWKQSPQLFCLTSNLWMQNYTEHLNVIFEFKKSFFTRGWI